MWIVCVQVCGPQCRTLDVSRGADLDRQGGCRGWLDLFLRPRAFSYNMLKDQTRGTCRAVPADESMAGDGRT